jgi:chemotaxis protein MotA
MAHLGRRRFRLGVPAFTYFDVCGSSVWRCRADSVCKSKHLHRSKISGPACIQVHSPCSHLIGIELDKLTITGIFFALLAIFGGSALKGSGIGALLSPGAFLIVMVGTLAAIMIQTPPANMKRALKIFKWCIRPPPRDLPLRIKRIVEWSSKARQSGLLALEPLLVREYDSFTRQGLQMLVDGAEPEMIRSVMEVELDTRERADLAAAKVFEGMGIYAPTLGIIGAVMGLMAVMQNLTDPSKLGHGIAAAFVATIYGIGSANLFFLPVSAKLKSTIAERVRGQEMLIEGLTAIAQGENPRHIEAKLRSYVN